MPHCHLDRILPRHPPLHHLRQPITGLMLVGSMLFGPMLVPSQTMLNVSAVSRSCVEQLSRTGRSGEWCRGTRGRVRWILAPRTQRHRRHGHGDVHFEE